MDNVTSSPALTAEVARSLSADPSTMEHTKRKLMNEIENKVLDAALSHESRASYHVRANYVTYFGDDLTNALVEQFKANGFTASWDAKSYLFSISW